ncbi:hypothetical protein [Nocardia tengchongensis]|uniref:hypothetical protein n=1 Tax=Nocardia tengchongensis TaxID=2055889 RepID=UPI00364A9D92
MHHSHRGFRVALLAAVALTAVGTAACGGSGDRAAKAVSATTTGNVITAESTDLGSIIVGWGVDHSPGEITTPKPEDVTARCTGNGDDLVVDISAPHGWQLTARKTADQKLTIANSDLKLDKQDVDTTTALAAIKAVDWSEKDQVDIAATAQAPKAWKAPASGGTTVYVAMHVDCR